MFSWMKNRRGRHSTRTVFPRSTSDDDYKYGFSAQVFPVLAPITNPVNHDYEEISGVKGCDLAYAVTSLSDMFEIIDYLPCLAASNQENNQDCQTETSSTGYQPVTIQSPLQLASETKVESNSQIVIKKKGMKRIRRLSRRIARWSTRRISSTSGKTTSSEIRKTSSIRHTVVLSSRRVCKKLKMAGSKVRLACFDACHDISRCSEVSSEDIFTSDDEQTKQTTKVPTPSISSSSDVSSGFYDDDNCDSDSRSRKSVASSDSDFCIENPLYDENDVIDVEEGEELYVYKPRTGFGMNRWYRHQ